MLPHYKKNTLIGPRREITFLREFANNKCADQPAHTRRLINTLVVGFWERTTIDLLAKGEISVFQLVYVLESCYMRNS